MAALIAGVALAVWPSIPFAVSPRPVPTAPAGAGAPAVAPPAPGPGALWAAPVALPSGVERVVGVGRSTLALVPDAMWPVSLQVEDRWQRLLGLPMGSTIGGAAAAGDGFVVAGVESDRTVLYRFSPSGRFAGARTVFGLRAGALVDAGSALVVFDAAAPTAVVLDAGRLDIDVPGIVSAAAWADGTAAIVTDTGDLYTSRDLATWTRRGGGFADVHAAGTIHAVGVSASTGLQRLDPDGTLVRLEGAPFGPVTSAGGEIVVYDWSTSGSWVSAGDGWSRLPFWASAGFVGSFDRFVGGTDSVTVVTRALDGTRYLQQVAEP